MRRVATIALAALVAAACGGESRRPGRRPAATATTVTADQGKPLDGPAPTEPTAKPIIRDLPEIVASKELRVLFTFNSTGYFIYRGDTMGYEYEVLTRFARDLKLALVPVVVRDSRELFLKLNRGEGDIVAAQLVRGQGDDDVAFSAGLYQTAPVVVQRKDSSPTAGMPAAVSTAVEREDKATRDLQPITIRARLVSRPEELAGKSVHLARTSPYRRRLVELSDELTQDIEVVEVDESTDHLIQRLAEGEIGYTVAADNLATLKTGEYTNLVIKPAIGPPQEIAFAVRRNAPRLREAIDQWLERNRKGSLLPVLYKKYFLDRRGFQRRAASRYLTGETGTLSAFDGLFREYAKIPGWDWRLVASQAYQESRFDPRARSWAGAVGLMQIMPRTARELRVNPADPRQSVEGACRYLWKLDKDWGDDLKSESERIKFILGAYNVGRGHVDDARRLAKKYGHDPDNWEDVAYWLIRKSKRAVYNDPVVRYGFARGTEPVAYVADILERHRHYREFVPAEQDTGDAHHRDTEDTEGALNAAPSVSSVSLW